MAARIDDRWLLPIEGAVSGSLTCLAPLLLPSGLGRSTFLVVGLAFGAVIAAHVRVFRGVRSAFRLIGFVATCAVAYTVSVLATVWSPFHPQLLNFSGTRSGAVDSSPFLVGGFLGAAIVCAGIFFFLAPPKTPTRFLVKAFCISLACGFLGVLGWSVGEQLGDVRWLPGLGGNRAFYSLYIIWQTGAAALFGLLLLPRQILAELPASAQTGGGPLQTKRRRTPRSVAATGFFVAVFAPVTWFIARDIQADRTVHRMRAARQTAERLLAAERPSMQDLPAVVPLPVGQVLVLRSVAGRPCGGHTLAPRPTGSPESVVYLAEYKLSETAAPDELFFADVAVFQYPNAAWAAYQTKEFMWDSVVENPKAVTTVTKFGNKVIMNTLEGSPSGGGNLYFYWASGNWFVKVTFHVSEEDEFLREYLDNMA